MLLVIIMLVGTIVMGWVTWKTLEFYSRIIKDINVKSEDTAAWFTEAAKKDIALYVNEKRGELIRRRILINAFKANAHKSGSEFVRNMNRVKGITPPASVCGHLSESYLNAALSLAA